MENHFKHVGLLTRKVEKGEREGRTTYTLISESTYDTTTADLWDALTNKERLPRWFAHVDGEFSLGGYYQVKDNASGTITHCEEQKSFSLTWEFAGDVSWLKVEITAIQKNKTQLRLEHLAYADGDHFKLYGPGAGGIGWDLAVAGLGHNIRTKQPAPSESECSTTLEYRRFVSSAAEKWGEAAIAAGFERENSVLAAKKTKEFYLGE